MSTICLCIRRLQFWRVTPSLLLRTDSRFANSQWETALLCNDVSHWLGESLESVLLLLLPCIRIEYYAASCNAASLYLLKSYIPRKQYVVNKTFVWEWYIYFLSVWNLIMQYSPCLSYHFSLEQKYSCRISKTFSLLNFHMDYKNTLPSFNTVISYERHDVSSNRRMDCLYINQHCFR